MNKSQTLPSLVVGKVSAFDDLQNPDCQESNSFDRSEYSDFAWANAYQFRSFHVHSRGDSQIAFTPNCCVILKGYSVRQTDCPAFQTQPGSNNVAAYILDEYSRTGSVPFEELDGCFSLILLDSQEDVVFLYRNIASSANVFYRLQKGGLEFATNLKELLKLSEATPEIEESLLPLYFLYRLVPGRETLFKNAYRLLPGELAVYRKGKFEMRFAQTFRDFGGTVAIESDVVRQIDQTLKLAVWNASQGVNRSSVLLSGGVDSTLLQSMWNEKNTDPATRLAFCCTVNHPRTKPEFEYAKFAADFLGVELVDVPVDNPYIDYLQKIIETTAETPNHVQAAYFPEIACEMVSRGIHTGISGEAGDGIFGVGTSYDLQLAQRLRKQIPSPTALLVLSRLCLFQRQKRARRHFEVAAHIDDLKYPGHPINQQAMFAHVPSVVACFGSKAVAQALQYRRDLVSTYGLDTSPIAMLHGANLLTSSINSASYWNTLFETQGAQLFSPFLDSRVLRLAANIPDADKFDSRNVKGLLKECLQRRSNHQLAHRQKRGFGQPIFEWMAAGGQLHSQVNQISSFSFVNNSILAAAKKVPNWFLYSLLCFDILQKSSCSGYCSAHAPSKR